MSQLRRMTAMSLLAVPLTLGVLLYGRLGNERVTTDKRVEVVRGAEEIEYPWEKSGKEWLNGYRKTQKFLKENPKMAFLPSKKDFKEGGEEKSLEGKLFSGFTREDAKDLAQVQGFYQERIQEIIGYLIKNKIGEKWSDIYSAVDLVFKDENYTRFLSEMYDTKEVDCKKISSTAVALEFCRLVRDGLDGEVTLSTGIYFGEKAHSGFGHQWSRFGNVVIDPSMRPDGKFQWYNRGEIYVPIVETTMTVRGKKANGTMKIVTMPESSLKKEK